MSACGELVDFAAAGVAPALRAVDCLAGEATASAFGRLFGTEGALAPVLTICLTLYIAIFALMLLTGRASLSVSSLVPRMLTVGLVLTFATSWIAYSQVLWNLAVAGPDWIASVLTGTAHGSGGSASLIFADRIDLVLGAIGGAGELAAAAGAPEAGAQAAGGSAGMFKPADIMWLGALLLLLGTAGVLLAARIALAVLMALGPVFVVLALFTGTRGLAAGWLRGVALTGIVPLLVVLGGSITLELLVPVVSALSESAALGAIGGRAAMALFVIAAVHVALMAMVMKVAVTMVTGWNVFGLAPAARAGREAPAAAPVLAAAAAGARPEPAMPRPARGAPAAASLIGAPAASSPGGAQAALGPSRRRTATLVAGGGIEPLQVRGADRARGIGSRFRAASNDGARAMLKPAGKETAK